MSDREKTLKALEQYSVDHILRAIHNADALIHRLETHYSFECEAGPLSQCAEWHDLQRCFQDLREYVSVSAEPEEREQDELREALDRSQLLLGRYLYLAGDIGTIDSFSALKHSNKASQQFRANRALLARTAPEEQDDER